MAIQLSYTSAEIEERLNRMDLDSTLTLSNHAADAKAVGDEIKTLKSRISATAKALLIENKDDAINYGMTLSVENGHLVASMAATE